MRRLRGRARFGRRGPGSRRRLGSRCRTGTLPRLVRRVPHPAHRRPRLLRSRRATLTVGVGDRLGGRTGLTLTQGHDPHRGSVGADLAAVAERTRIEAQTDHGIATGTLHRLMEFVEHMLARFMRQTQLPRFITATDPAKKATSSAWSDRRCEHLADHRVDPIPGQAIAGHHHGIDHCTIGAIPPPRGIHPNGVRAARPTNAAAPPRHAHAPTGRAPCAGRAGAGTPPPRSWRA